MHCQQSLVRDWFVQDREMVSEHPALRNAEVRKDRNRNPKEFQTQMSTTDPFTCVAVHSRGESCTPPSYGYGSEATVSPPTHAVLPTEHRVSPILSGNKTSVGATPYPLETFPQPWAADGAPWPRGK